MTKPLLDSTHDLQDSSTVNPYVFVVGCPRSGTTLLQRMLDNHPQLAAIPPDGAR